MWWNEQDRRWEPHPDCSCGRRFSCICSWLDPLDEQGKPIKGTIIQDIRGLLTIIGKEVTMNYSDLHKALDEAAYEIKFEALLAHRKRNSQEIDRLHAENDRIDDEIERIELKGQAA